jgi:urease accessory protein
MTTTITEIIGHADEKRFAGRSRDVVPVTAADAVKARLRRASEAGEDLAIQLERGSFLFDGAVLHDDGERLIVIERALEQVLVVSLDPALARADAIRAAALVAHAFGNQHVPVEVVDATIRVPVTTSPDVARATVERLGLIGVSTRVLEAKLAVAQPLTLSGTHTH